MTETETPPTDGPARPSFVRRHRWALLGGGAVGVALIAFVMVWFQPHKLFIDDVVDEDLPGLVTAGAAVAGADDMADDEMADDEMTDDQMADEGSFADPMDGDDMDPRDDEMADDLTEDLADDASTADEPPTVDVPTAISTGDFISLDHPTSGRALLVLLPDGSHVLRFEDLETDNGPDLRVILSPAEPGAGDYATGSVELGTLKGNIGDQNYEIPADVDLSAFHSVVIWCERFSSPFGVAPIHGGEMA